MRALAVAVLALCPMLWAQASIPAGTVLAVELSTSLDSRHARPGQRVSGRIMQDVPLPGGAKIPARAKVTGHIVQSTPTSTGARLTVQFDTVSYGKRRLQVVTDLRAMASMLEVNEAQAPTTGPGIGDVYVWMDTNLIGGDAAYGLNGPVMSGSDLVGEKIAGGVLGKPRANSQAGCRAELSGNHHLQALWLFSPDACGLYGFPGLRIVHAGRTDPQGQIVLESRPGPLRVGGGSGLLLRVIGRTI